MSPETVNHLPGSGINTIGQPFIELLQVESTNSYAIDKIQAKLAAHGTVWFAREQTAGRGQRGKEWFTEPGSNIILSVVADMSSLSMHQQFPLSAAVALAAHDLFNKYTQGDTAIKWPNDIYWRDRKAAGILIENVLRGNTWHWAVIGIGMNINQTSFPENMRNPVSLKQITGKDFNAVALAQELCNNLEQYYQQLKRGEVDAIMQQYHQHLYRYKQPVRLKKGNISFNCTIEGVSNEGDLLISNGPQERFSFGEVEWVIPVNDSPI